MKVKLTFIPEPDLLDEIDASIDRIGAIICNLKVQLAEEKAKREKAEARLGDLHRLRPASEWTEADGYVLWWYLACDWAWTCECCGPRHLVATSLTHWSPLPRPEDMEVKP